MKHLPQECTHRGGRRGGVPRTRRAPTIHLAFGHLGFFFKKLVSYQAKQPHYIEANYPCHNGGWLPLPQMHGTSHWLVPSHVWSSLTHPHEPSCGGERWWLVELGAASKSILLPWDSGSDHQPFSTFRYSLLTEIRCMPVEMRTSVVSHWHRSSDARNRGKKHWKSSSASLISSSSMSRDDGAAEDLLRWSCVRSKIPKEAALRWSCTELSLLSAT